MDRFLAGEASGTDAARHHLQECTRCKERLDTLRAQQRVAIDQASKNGVLENILQTSEPGKQRGLSFTGLLRRPILWLPAAVATAAVCLLVVLHFTIQIEPEKPDLVRIKGAAQFEVLHVIGKSARRLTESDRLHAGNKIAFRAQATNGGWISLVNLPEDGASVLLSWEGKSKWSLPKGQIVQLPLSAELDDSTQDERIFAFFCNTQVDSRVLIKHLEQIYPSGPTGRRDLTVERLIEVAGCTVKSIQIRRTGSQKRSSPNGP